MKFILLSLILLMHSASASMHSRPIEDFNGDELVIGAGNYSYFTAQKKINKDKEYSIDVNRRVYPCRVADGLAIKTYMKMPDARFSCITFEHIAFSPFAVAAHLHACGMYRRISSGAYCPESWDQQDQGFACEMLRILKPAGQFIFKSCVLDSVEGFDQMNLSITGSCGIEAWKAPYEKAGFENIEVKLLQHEQLNGHYLQMTAIKASNLKRQKSEQ